MSSASYRSSRSTDTAGSSIHSPQIEPASSGSSPVSEHGLAQTWTGSTAAPDPRHASTASDSTALASQFHIEPHILRGVRLCTSIRRVGSLWRRSPLDLDEANRTKLYTLSEQRVNLDYFISHSWATAGWKKYLALVIFVAGKFLLLSLILTIVITFFVLLAYDIPCDPLPDVFPAKVQGWQGQVRAHPGVGVFFGVVACFAVILLSSTMSQYASCGRGDSWAFLDVVCISQTDKALQAKGVKSLAGFILKSKELLVLWSAPYFSRKWCVFEVAAFMKSHSHEQINFQPVFVGITAMVGTIMSFVGCVMYVVSAALQDNSRRSPLFLAPFICGIGWGINCLRRCLQLQQIMDEQLANFDARQALCREQADSNYIDKSIEQWYGGIAAFNEFVRNHLRRHLLAKASVVHFSYAFCLLANPFEPLIKISYTAAYIRAGVSTAAVVSLLIEITCATFFKGPLGMITVYLVASKLASPRVAPRCGIVLSFLSAFFIVIVAVAVTEFSVRARNTHVLASVVLAVLYVSTTWLVFCCLLPKYRRASAEVGKMEEPVLAITEMDVAEEPLEDKTPSPISVVPSPVGLQSEEIWCTEVYHI